MVAALRCVRPQFQWYQLAYATEIKSIQLHDSIVRHSQKIVSFTLHYITLHYILAMVSLALLLPCFLAKFLFLDLLLSMPVTVEQFEITMPNLVSTLDTNPDFGIFSFLEIQDGRWQPSWLNSEAYIL